MAEIDSIGAAARENKVVRMEYQKKNGDMKTYFIEPYSIRDGDYLFGFNREKGHIEKYIIGNIISASETDETFEPRWEVEF